MIKRYANLPPSSRIRPNQYNAIGRVVLGRSLHNIAAMLFRSRFRRASFPIIEKDDVIHKTITYRNATSGRSSHGHIKYAQKIW